MAGFEVVVGQDGVRERDLGVGREPDLHQVPAGLWHVRHATLGGEHDHGTLPGGEVCDELAQAFFFTGVEEETDRTGQGILCGQHGRAPSKEGVR